MYDTTRYDSAIFLCAAYTDGYIVYRVHQQEAQLSQRDRAVIHVIEYFAKSLKVIQAH